MRHGAFVESLHRMYEGGWMVRERARSREKKTVKSRGGKEGSEFVPDKFYGVLVLYIRFAFNHRSKENEGLMS